MPCITLIVFSRHRWLSRITHRFQIRHVGPSFFFLGCFFLLRNNRVNKFSTVTKSVSYLTTPNEAKKKVRKNIQLTFTNQHTSACVVCTATFERDVSDLKLGERSVRTFRRPLSFFAAPLMDTTDRGEKDWVENCQVADETSLNTNSPTPQANK